MLARKYSQAASSASSTTPNNPSTSRTDQVFTALFRIAFPNSEPAPIVPEKYYFRKNFAAR